MNNICEIDGLYKSYNNIAALRGISMQVEKGSIYGLIGADGAGKSTVMKIACTLLSYERGSVKILGHDPLKQKLKIRREAGYMPQIFAQYPDLTVIENISFFADLFGISGTNRKTTVDRLLEFSNLTSFTERKAGNLSGGMKQKLALCCVLVHKPQLLFLDEPTTGVDPVSRSEFWKILQGLTDDDGCSIIVSTPYMDEAKYCDRLGFIHKGKILSEGRPDDILSSYPYDIYIVENALPKDSFRCSVSTDGTLKYLYPSGSCVKAAVAKDADRKMVLKSVTRLIPDVKNIKIEDPDIEDLFYHLTSSDQEPKWKPVSALKT